MPNYSNQIVFRIPSNGPLTWQQMDDRASKLTEIALKLWPR